MNHVIKDRDPVPVPRCSESKHSRDAAEGFASREGSPPRDSDAPAETIERFQSMVRQIGLFDEAPDPEFQERHLPGADGTCTAQPQSTSERTTLTPEQHQTIGEELAKGRRGSVGFGIDKETLLTPRDQHMILFHAGELGNEQLAIDIWREAYNADVQGIPEMAAGRFFVRARAAIARHCDESRASKAIASVGDATTALFSKRGDERKRQLIVHPSTYEPGMWQLTAVDERGAWGHTVHATKQQAIRSAVGAIPLADGGADYELTWHDKSGKPAPF